MTLVTIQLPGQFTFSQLCKLFNGMHSAVKVIQSDNRTGTLSKVKEPPHAFATFNTANHCANDTQWNARTMGVQKNKRPSLCEIRTLRLENLRHDSTPKDQA